jgi:hypothetical protein
MGSKLRFLRFSAGSVELRKTLPWGFAQLVHIAGGFARRAVGVVAD